MSDFMIETKNLTKYYGINRALENLVLKVGRGSIYTLLGLNGSGKSTLVKLLTGQLPKYAGEIRLFDKKLEPAAAPGLFRRLGYVPEDKAMYEYMTPRQVLDFCSSFYSNWDSACVKRCLDAFDIPLGKRIRDLSRGTRCQLALTSAMGNNPELLILDEPTEGLDPCKRSQFFSILLDIVTDSGKTVFITTNNISDVEKIADHIGFMRDGKLCLEGPAEELAGNFRKVRIAFSDGFEPCFDNWDGIDDVQREKRSFLLHISRNADEQVERLKNLPVVFMDVMNMSIEDIFMDINGGRVV